MPLTQSAKKALRQSEKRRVKNLRQKRQVNRLAKEITKAVQKNKLGEAKKLLPSFYKTVDKTAKTGYFKKGKASRKKSRLTRLVNKGA